MVRCDLIDAIDKSKLNTGAEKLPFGGVKVILVGDHFHLPPVVSRNEKLNSWKRGYSSPFFFSAHCLDQLEWEYVQLEKVYRQADEEFISILNSIRENKYQTKRFIA